MMLLIFSRTRDAERRCWDEDVSSATARHCAAIPLYTYIYLYIYIYIVCCGGGGTRGGGQRGIGEGGDGH